MDTSSIITSFINANSRLESKLRELTIRNEELEKKIKKYELSAFRTEYFSSEVRTKQRILKNIRDIFSNINEDFCQSKVNLSIKSVQITEKNEHNFSLDKNFVNISKEEKYNISKVLYTKDKAFARRPTTAAALAKMYGETVINNSKLAARVFHILSKEAFKVASKVQKLQAATSTPSLSAESCDCSAKSSLTVIITLLCVVVFSIIALVHRFTSRRSESTVPTGEIRLRRRRFYHLPDSTRGERQRNTIATTSDTATSTPFHRQSNQTSGIDEETANATNLMTLM